MDKIKLVIWDLDETFWTGTLSEEGVTKIDKNIEIVKELTNRGIINSIVSKNDLNAAKEKLEELGVWEYFVFPIIEWKSKGPLIKEVIERCQLRDINVLFIDDNHLNLEEAKYYNPNIHTRFPEFIDQILDHKAFKGKDDSSHSRLKQYKILEEKYIDSKNYTSNVDFLKDSMIEISFIDDLQNHKDRIYELIERTNQLNFTKKRLSEGEIDVLINNSKYKSRLIKVNDKYGDYGIVGFYAFDEKKNRLEHFVFSCRIINLGVAQYVYQKLNTPSIEIIPEVSEQLDGLDPTWIHEKIIDTVNISNSVEKDDRIKIFFKGGCDLEQMLFYLGDKYYDIHQETNYVCGNGFPIHQEHSQVLIDSVELGNDKKDFVIENIPFTDESFYETKVFEGDYNCFIYSVLMDYTQDIYISNDKTIKLPFGGYGEIWTNENEHNKIIEKFNNRGIKIVTKEKLNFFKNNFYYQGQISPENFIRNLKKIRKMINELIPIIVVNGAEVLSPNAKEAEATKRHILMNNAVDDYVLNTPNIYLLDLRNIVTSEKQLLNSIRHYKRDVYKQMAEELLKLLNNIFNNDISTKISNHSFTRYKMLLKKTIKTINRILKK